jgi:hypothetical protein
MLEQISFSAQNLLEQTYFEQMSITQKISKKNSFELDWVQKKLEAVSIIGGKKFGIATLRFSLQNGRKSDW